jgi:NTE family protein
MRPVANHIERIGKIIASAEDAADMRRRMGAAALDMDAASDDSWQTQWRATVASRLPSHRWPQRPVLITAVDAHTGEPVVFDRHSGVDLADAVAASCASGRPYRIGDNRHIDGGYRRNENADLAAGYARVLVLSPFGGRSLQPLDWGMQLAAQVDELRARGSRVETIFPDSGSGHMFGANAMDLSLRPPAARAGYDQGKAVAQQLAVSGTDAEMASALLGARRPSMAVTRRREHRVPATADPRGARSGCLGRVGAHPGIHHGRPIARQRPSPGQAADTPRVWLDRRPDSSR